MSIRNNIFSVAFGIASMTAANAEGLRPLGGESIDLGGISGIAYYTVERDGFRVVATLAQGEAGTPIRVISVLAPGQRVVLSTPRQSDAVEITRKGDSVVVRKARATAN
ncbi:hypothetical protein [Bradyrhizobium elkanii]|uniref:Uncharacterized protein n=1 Tax=Bradyrhizobium elkanii TaxID=29448 RepID=A0ABV4EYP1_BRAEL|nr:hypothetical protein [Bradyrhizobium elkanii]MCP1757290.1 hypothetical protein [Bradyrhizobium elkanii]MCP1982803.1 hypothetical protein [Bradyrhizobium elkanii]MCS3691190.1 hypothetical protein [Bradyrhizobium elkanii]MCS3882413.1 hypothetical protein [Bradyrhizobium elkanii]MCS4219172.1 hypothetical protein [Bradyrhizobium elkanii]